MRRRVVPALIALLLLPGAGAQADPLVVGDEIQPFELADQHGKSNRFDESVKLVLFTREMDGGAVARRALSDASEELLREQHAIYVADISRMPGLVARLFAIPKLRDRPYPILLDRDGAATRRFPAEQGSVTVLITGERIVERVLHLSTPEEVRRLLGLPPT